MMDDEPVIIYVSATCRTEGCTAYGITYTNVPVQVHTVEPRLRVICAGCGNTPEIVEPQNV